MLLVLIGKSGSGKDSVAKRLAQNGWERIVKYTDRPKRQNEIDGVDYHFCYSEDLSHLIEIGSFISVQTFKVYNGDYWRYAIDFESLEDAIRDEKNAVLIATPHECDNIFNFVEENEGLDNIKVLYLRATRGVRKERLLKRGDNLKEIKRRLDADAEDFTDDIYYDEYFDTDDIPIDILVDEIEYYLEKDLGIRKGKE